MVVFVPFVGFDRKLIGARLADRRDNMLCVEPTFAELVGKPIKQFGVRRRIARADVVDRFDDADSGEIAPQARTVRSST